MVFTRINRDNGERGFIVVYNSYASAALTVGQCVRWDYTTDCDGISVERCAAASDGFPVAGVVVGTIAVGGYGIIQVYGPHTSVRVRTMTASGHAYHESRAAVAKGVSLCYDITAEVFCAEGVGGAETAQVLKPFAFALAANASFTTKAIACFIKAM